MPTQFLGHSRLWALIADAVGQTPATLNQTSPALDPQIAVAMTRRLLDHPQAPWRQTPTQWLTEKSSGPLLVTHRGSCCLAYQCDRDAREPDDQREQPDREYIVSRPGW